jgi:hypothetical protein
MLPSYFNLDKVNNRKFFLLLKVKYITGKLASLHHGIVFDSSLVNQYIDFVKEEFISF